MYSKRAKLYRKVCDFSISEIVLCEKAVHYDKLIVAAAIRRKLPFRVVLFDSWYLAEEFIACLCRRRTDWISSLKKDRHLETNSIMLKHMDGTHPVERSTPQRRGFSSTDPVNAYRAVRVRDQTYWVFTLTIRFCIWTEALILYASQQLEHSQKANDLFDYLFAKQQAFGFTGYFVGLCQYTTAELIH
jgi:hypothetical protein